MPKAKTSSLKGIRLTIDATTEPFVIKANQIEKKVREIATAGKTLNRQLRFEPSNVDILNQKLRTLKDRQAAVKEQAKQYQEAISAKKLKGGGVVKLTNVFNKLKNDLKIINSELTATQKKINDANIKNASSASRAIDKYKTQIRAFSFAAVFAGRSALQLRRSLGKIATIADDSVYNFDLLEQRVVSLAQQFGLSSAEIAEGWYFALSSGIKATKSMTDELTFMETAAKLSVSGFSDVSDTVKTLAGIMNAYGVETKDAEKVANTLIKTQNSGIITVHELSQFIGKATPLAANLGVRLEEVGAAVATITRNGLPASRATTVLNRLFTDFAKSGTRVSTILKEETGKSFKELIAEGHTLYDILKVVKDSGKDAGKEFVDLFSSIRAAGGALGIFSNNGKDYQEVLEGMIEANDGALNSAYTGQKRFREFDITLQKVKETFRQFGEGVLRGIKPAIDSVNSLSKDMKGLNTIVKVLGENLTYGFLFIGLTKVVAGVKALTAALTALSVAGSAATLSGAFATLTAMVLVLKTATELLGKLFAPEDDSKYGYRNDSAKLGAEGKIYYARDIETVNKARRERALEAYDKQLGYFGYDVYNPTGKQKPTEQNIETVNININAADKSPEDIAEAVNEKLIEGRT